MFYIICNLLDYVVKSSFNYRNVYVILLYLVKGVFY